MIAEQVEALLAQMTIEEKIGQMNQYNGFWEVTGPAPSHGDGAWKYEHLRSGLVGSMLNVVGAEETRRIQRIVVEETRLGIPIIFGFDVIHGLKTISPIPLAESASWDLEAIELSARLAATEASAAGIHWTFAPMVDISRDARWGRVMEGAGEDPYFGSQVAKARIKGFQGEDLSQPDTIAATAKHFAGYGFAEGGRDYNTVDVGLNTLQNEIFPPFYSSVKAGVKTFMNAFNELNGVPATGNRFLQREILKGNWNFDGFMVSDWASIKEMIKHGTAQDRKEAARLAIIAGCDMDMESYAYVDFLKELVEEGSISEDLIDDAVRRILTLKYELGLFDDPYRYCNSKREQAVTGSTVIRKACLDIAKKSIVLLKNENNLLPLNKKGQNIAVIGPLAEDERSPLGSWVIGADNQKAVSVLMGLHQYSGNTINYSKGVNLITSPHPSFGAELQVNTTDRSGMDEALESAKQADVVIMVLGEHAFHSGEARSRTRLDLPGLQQELLEKVYAVNQNIVLVLLNGRPLALPWAAEHIPAIVEAWQLGCESGHAIAQVLYGDYNPSGKLPMSFPRHVGQMPLSYNQKRTGRPNPEQPGVVFWSHYIDERNDALFPFGYGLSYTHFEISPIQLSNQTIKLGEELTATVQVKNVGQAKGKEVVQLYVHDVCSSTTRPVRELKGFKLIELEIGEERQVEFKITNEEMKFYNNEDWVVEPGDFIVFIGNDSTTQNQASFKVIE